MTVRAMIPIHTNNRLRMLNALTKTGTIEREHGPAQASVRVLTPADAEAYRAVRVAALEETPMVRFAA